MTPMERVAEYTMELNEGIAHRMEALQLEKEEPQGDPWDEVYSDIVNTIASLSEMYIGLKFAEQHIREMRAAFGEDSLQEKLDNE